MSYETFPEIVDAVQSEMNRTDLTDAQVASFIRISEIRCYRALRIPPMEKKVALSIVPAAEEEADGVAKAAFPARWLETITLTDSAGNPIQYISQQYFRKLNSESGTKLRYFTREAEDLLVWPATDEETLQMYYYETPAAGNATDNTAPATYPYIGDALFFGATSEGWRFFREWEKYGTYRQMYADALEVLQEQFDQSDISGSTLITKNPYQ